MSDNTLLVLLLAGIAFDWHSTYLALSGDRGNTEANLLLGNLKPGHGFHKKMLVVAVVLLGAYAVHRWGDPTGWLGGENGSFLLLAVALAKLLASVNNYILHLTDFSMLAVISRPLERVLPKRLAAYLAMFILLVPPVLLIAELILH